MARRVYVGGLPDDVRSSEIRDIFDKFGAIRDVDIKTPRAPGRGCARLGVWRRIIVLPGCCCDSWALG
jgi:RNA recognition motif-containing protein